MNRKTILNAIYKTKQAMPAHALPVIASQDPPNDQPNRLQGSDHSHGVVIAKAKPILARPPLFKVLMLNDDYTPMDFVIITLETFFDKSSDEANMIMLNVHQKGVGVCGIFTKDIADTKAQMVIDWARENGHPLMCQIEKM